MFIAENFAQFKTLFVNQLKNMLSPDELGAFILVLANSQQDDFLKTALDAELKKLFSSFKNKYNSEELKATQDDIDVFKQLIDIDLKNITCWQYRNAGVWELVYNSMRKLRPARSSNEILTSIHRPFDETKFHFNKPFLKPEILWQGNYNGNDNKGNAHKNNNGSNVRNINLRVLYNKFPFSDYHLLLAISPEENLPQFLTQETHEYMFSMVNELDAVLPGFGVGFNSLAAGASVNHLHFQGFVRERIFPIEDRCWLHNGGELNYPLQVHRFENDAWLYIKNLIDSNVAFNCLYRKNVCYVIPRQFQGAVNLPGWLQGAGWIDVAGVITVSNAETFSSIDESSITQALALLSIG